MKHTSSFAFTNAAEKFAASFAGYDYGYSYYDRSKIA